MLQGIDVSFGETSIFVLRLAWVPSNYPCRIDGGDQLPAEQILTQTETDAQVLTGYWVSRDNLIRFVELVDIGTADFEIYRPRSLSVLGSIAYFESTIGLWGIDGLLGEEFSGSLSPEELRLNNVRDHYRVVKFSNDHSSRQFSRWKL